MLNVINVKSNLNIKDVIPCIAQLKVSEITVMIETHTIQSQHPTLSVKKRNGKVRISVYSPKKKHSVIVYSLSRIFIFG